jgi:hypothetical protein
MHIKSISVNGGAKEVLGPGLTSDLSKSDFC